MLLIIAAVLPAAYLMFRVYRSDRLERESPWLVISLVLLGMISTALAATGEQIGSRILLYLGLVDGSVFYNFLFYFLVVGPAEEGFKSAVLRWRTWRHREFNCQYDGVVYAVFVSLGFALWENLGYVLFFEDGLRLALARAVTAVPGHACFGVFMGVWYGIAKRWEIYGDPDKSRRARWLCVIVPAALHGCYDFIASLEGDGFVLVFLAFIIVMFITALRIVKRLSAKDQYITQDQDDIYM